MKIKELSAGILAGDWTSVQLVEAALKRIAENDQDGKALNTVSEINPNALFEARAMDEEIREHGLRSVLHGVPVLLKDNIDVRHMHTTAGSSALQDLIAEEDAYLAKRLREAGAVILGKANLSEFAYFMSRQGMPSGYSSLSGQVGHAYVPGRNPSGSSSGSAVAVSARFVPYAIGTETDGSLMSPGIANAITALKPTVGLVSRQGILPISHIQDTAGPMGTCVEDVAGVLDILAGRDEEDPATYTCRKKDYTGTFTKGCRGMRIGLLHTQEDARSEEVMRQTKRILEEAGAETVDVQPEKILLEETECLMHEFKQGLNLYLSQHSSACRTLEDIIAFNQAHPERCLKYGQDLLEGSDALSGQLKEPAYILKRAELKKEAEELLAGMMKKQGVQCLITVCDRTRTNLAPVSGNPCMCLPAAVLMDEADQQPLSWYLMAGAYDEDVLLRTAYVLEQAAGIRNLPDWTTEFGPY
ncbi:MAG: hypothetical protein K6E41_01030 [Solobacterium sp.]|nr:hypothetical protein [Solobacterium sp.]